MDAKRPKGIVLKFQWDPYSSLLFTFVDDNVVVFFNIKRFLNSGILFSDLEETDLNYFRPKIALDLEIG